MSRPPRRSERALDRALNAADELCLRCDAEFSLSWDPWRDRWRVTIWHAPDCEVPEAHRTRTGRPYFEAKDNMKRILAPVASVAPEIFTKHLADSAT